MFELTKITLLFGKLCMLCGCCHLYTFKFSFSSLMTQSKYSSEGLSEFWVEDCVNYRIDTRIDISQEGCGLEGKVAGRSVQVIFYA